MALTTYTGLQAAVADWLHRTDLTTVIVDCVALAEEKFNRRLRTKRQELVLAETAIDASFQVAIPNYTLAVKRIWRTGSPLQSLDVASIEYVMMRQASQGLATAFAWEDAYWRFDGTGSVAGVLYRSIPPLADNSTNWLLTSHPSAYLYGTLAEVAAYTRDMEAVGMFTAQLEQKLAEINLTEGKDAFSGPLVVRAS